MKQAESSSPVQRVFAVLNKRAGTLIDRDPAEVRSRLQSAFREQGHHIVIELASGVGICRAIDRAVLENYDTIIVGGGDGSANYAAAKLAGSELTLGVLPLGTMNLLARDLGVSSVLEEAIATLPYAKVQRIDLATLNGRSFHTLSGVGFFSQMARAREETRDLPGRLLRMGVAAFHAFARAGRMSISIEIDGRTREFDSFAVLVTNNRFGADWQRQDLSAGTLEVHIAENFGALGKLRAGAELLSGGWRESAGIQSYTARRVSIATGRQRGWVSTDGELARERMPLTYGIRPRALKLLVPSPAPPK
jgi:diacylglycerol kinase family enzyme